MRQVNLKTALTCGVFGLAAAVIFLLPDELAIRQSSAQTPPSTIRLTGVVRDFRSTHPDMNVVPAAGYGHFAGNVARGLAATPTLESGYLVTSQWRERLGNPIAPHLYSDGSGMAKHPLAGFSGVGVQGTVLVENTGLVTGSPLVVASNQTGTAGTITVTNAGRIEGDVFVGPGGDPSTEVVTTSGGAITGATGTLPAEVPFPPIVVPDPGPSSGDLMFIGGSVISGDLHADTLTVRGIGSILIDGNVRIVCTKLRLENEAELQLSPGSRLDLYILGDVATAAGGKADDVVIENGCAVNTLLGDPALVNCYYLNDERLAIRNTSEVVWNLYAPKSNVVIVNGARMTGNVVSRKVVVKGGLTDKFGNLTSPSTLNVTGTFASGGGPAADACGVAINDTAGAAGAGGTGGITSPATFDEWYTNVLGTNLSARHAITLVNNGTGVFEYLENEFHPIDGRLLGNEGDDHNYYFTYAVRMRFVYEACADQFFEFGGNDDAWLYVDDALAMDLGGMLQGTGQYVPMDRLDLVDGESYEMHLFYAQRQGISSVFRIRTNISIMGDLEVAMVTDAGD